MIDKFAEAGTTKAALENQLLPIASSFISLEQTVIVLGSLFVKLWILDMPPDRIRADVGAPASIFGRARGGNFKKWPRQ